MNKPKSLCTSRRRVEREEGSAYIVTLMVLFVLTALGLSLTLITSTESTLGAQERTIQRTFYAADSGLGLALSALMSRSDCESRCVFYESNADDEYSPEDLLDQIEVSKMAALDDPECWNRFMQNYAPKIKRWREIWGRQSTDADNVAQTVLPAMVFLYLAMVIHSF